VERAFYEGDKMKEKILNPVPNVGPYLLVTPIKDEKPNLPKLRDTIFNQTLLPKLWVIVDSGSTDGSYETAIEVFKDINWVRIIKQKKFFEKGYGHKNFAQAVTEGIREAIRLAKKYSIDYKYIGKTDATPILAKDYFETLIQEMEKNPRLAIVCGVQHVKTNNKKITMTPRHNVLRLNDIRLYRREFIEHMGGYPLSYYPDGVLAVKAINRGWGVKITSKTYFIKPRLGGSKIGVWKGYKLKGKALYYLWYHPLIVLGIAMYNSIKYPPHYQGLAMIIGWWEEILNKGERSQDVDVKEYFRNKLIKDLIRLK